MNGKTSVVVVRCEHPSDRALCAALARTFARDFGLNEVACWEFATSVAELVSNVTRHAGAGEMTIRRVEHPEPAIEVVVQDHGPGIADVAQAMTDGWSEGRQLKAGESRQRGLGMGLGAVQRLMSELSIRSSSTGTVVVARKWIGRCA